MNNYTDWIININEIAKHVTCGVSLWQTEINKFEKHCCNLKWSKGYRRAKCFM